MVLRSVLLYDMGPKGKAMKQNTAKDHVQSVKVKMALTEDLTQKQHTFGECTLYMFLIAHGRIKKFQITRY